MIRIRKEALLFIAVLALTIAVVAFLDISHTAARVSLGMLFTVVLWFRSEQNPARWIAIAVLWLGFLILMLWTHFHP